MRWLLAAAALMLLAQAPPAAADTTSFVLPPRPTPDDGLASLIQSALPVANGTFGVAVLDLETGRSAFVNADQRLPAASLFKLLVLYEYGRQKQAGLISGSDVLTVSDDDFEDDGVNTVGEPGAQVMAGTAAQLMITVSDNVAANVLATRLGLASINRAAADLGLQSSRIHTWLADDPVPPDELNFTSARDMMLLLERIASGQAIDPDFSRQMLDLLLADEINDRLPAGLPAGVPVAHKTGDLDAVVNDAGIVYGPRSPFIIAVLAADVEDRAAAAGTIRAIARATFDYLESS